jgi:hypothetical protein
MPIFAPILPRPAARRQRKSLEIQGATGQPKLSLICPEAAELFGELVNRQNRWRARQGKSDSRDRRVLGLVAALYPASFA